MSLHSSETFEERTIMRVSGRCWVSVIYKTFSFICLLFVESLCNRNRENYFGIYRLWIMGSFGNIEYIEER